MDEENLEESPDETEEPLTEVVSPNEPQPVPPLTDTSVKKENDSYYMLHADWLAVLKNAPDLQTGMELLTQAYQAKAWDDEDKARSVVSEYAQDLRYRFGDLGQFSAPEIGKLEPVRFAEVEGKGADDEERNLNQVDEWVRMNKEVLAKSNDPKHFLNRIKLEKSIDEQATNLRRLARYSEGNTVVNATEDALVRLAEGMTAAPSELIWGRNNAYVKALRERTDPAYDDDYGTAILSGIGTLEGTVLSGGIGGAAYLGATGAGAIRSKYQQALDYTGDETKAAQAAAVETLAQGIMLGGVGKIAGGVKGALSKEVEKISEPLFKRILKPVVTGVGTQVVGGEGSQVSEAIATGQQYQFDPNAALKRASLGAIFGAIGAGGELMRPVKPDPLISNGGVEPPVEKSVTGAQEIHNQPSSVVVSYQPKSPGATELGYSARFSEIEAEQGKWTAAQKEAATKAKETFRELDHIQEQIDTLTAKHLRTKNETEKERIQTQIDNHQKAYDELAVSVSEDQPGVKEARLLQEKEEVAAGIKSERLLGAPRAGELKAVTPKEELPEGWAETIPVGEVAPAPPPKVKFTTKDGSEYAVTEEGSTVRTKDDRAYYATDRTFFVDKKTANTLGILNGYEPGQGSTVRVFTDGADLYARGIDGEKVKIPVLAGPEPGAHAVEVNKPKIVFKPMDSSIGSPEPVVEYRSFVSHEITNVEGVETPLEGGKSAGAMALIDIPPLGVGVTLAHSKMLDESVRDAFKAETADGKTIPLDRYFPITNVQTETEVGKFIAEKGMPKATTEFLESDPRMEAHLRVELGHQLIKTYNQAARAARSAGDMESAERYAGLAIDVGKKTEEIGLDLGRGVQSFATWSDLDPDIRIAGLRGKLNEQALQEVAAKEGYTVNDLKNVVKLEEQVNTDIDSFNKLEKVKGTLSKAEQARLSELKEKQKQITGLKDKIAAAKKKKQSKLTGDDEKSLTQLLKSLPNIREGTTPYNKVIEAIQKITNKVERPAKSQMLGYWMSNTLLSPATHIINILNTGLHVADVSLALATAGRPDLGYQFVKGMLGSASEAAGGAARAFLSGEAKSRLGAEDSKFQTRSDYVKEGPRYFNKLGYALRALSAEDEFFYHNAKEGYAKAVTYYNAKKGGLSGETLRQKVASDLNQSPEAWKDAEKEARSLSKSLKETTGIELTEAQIKNTAWELLESKRPDLLQKDSHRFSLAQTFNGPQTGFIGYVTKALMTMTEAPITIGSVQIRPLRYVTPFLRIGGSLANAFSDYAGAGYIKAMLPKELEVSSLLKPELVQKPALQQRTELGRAIMGTVTTGILYGMASEFLKDKDPYFAVYGPGPKDADMVAQLRQQKNWMPYSIKIGEHLLPFKWTPYVFPLGAIGAIHDKIRWSKSYQKADERNAISILTAGALGAFSDNSYLKTIGDVIAILQDTPGKSVEDIPINVGRGFIPASSALRAIANITDDPIVTKGDLWAKIVSGIPVAQSIGTKPALNVFGEKIPKTMAERMSVTRLWNTESTDPDFQWLAHNGYDLPDAGSQDIKLGTTGRKAIQEERTKNYGPIYADHLTPDERYELTEKSGPDIRKIVSRYRTTYGSAGFSQRVQDRLKADIAVVRSTWKRRLFLH